MCNLSLRSAHFQREGWGELNTLSDLSGRGII
jgi:hypothetical protein